MSDLNKSTSRRRPSRWDQENELPLLSHVETIQEPSHLPAPTMPSVFNKQQSTSDKASTPRSSRRPSRWDQDYHFPPLSNFETIGEPSSRSFFLQPPNKRQASSDVSGQPSLKRDKHTDTFRTSSIINVQTNQFEIKTGKMPEVIEKLNIEIFALNTKDILTKVNETSVHGDVPKQYHRWGLFGIWKQLFWLDQFQELFNREVSFSDGIYDCATSCYFTKGLYNGADEEVIILDKSDVEVEDSWTPIARLGNIEIISIGVMITRAKGENEVYTRGEKSATPENTQELVQFFEALTSQVSNSRHFFRFGNSIYARSEQTHPDEGRCLEMEGKKVKAGFDKTMRVVTDKEGKPRFVMSIDICRSPFFMPLMVNEMLSMLLTNKKDANVEELIESSRTTEMLNELIGLAVVPTHLPKNGLKVFYIHGFGKSAKEEKFEIDGKTITIEEYFLDKYNCQLQHPLLPLVIQKKKNGYAYYPMELLRIERGQRVKNSKVSPRIQQAMADSCSFLPAEHITCARHFLLHYMKIRENKFFMAFGIEIEAEPLRLSAKILPPPLINFAPPAGDSTTIMDDVYLRTSQLNQVVIISFDDVLESDHPRRGDFDWLLDIFHKKNVSTPKGFKFEIKFCAETDHNTLRRIMQEEEDSGVSLVLAVTREKCPDVHDVLKLFENQIGIQTQHICMQTWMAMKKGEKQTVDNVMSKLNVKCGGLNFSTSVPSHVCDDARRVESMFFDNTLFIGFDISHSGAQLPSVVGYSYTFGNHCDLGGNSYLQKPREHRLMYLPKHFKDIINNYMSATKKMPEKVVIYRSGVGEGDFEKIKDEVEQMKSVFKTEGKTIPQFLMIIVSKTSHVRLFPADLNINSREEPLFQNVPTGTCIAGGITAFNQEEFYLVSQSANIGTARPARYTIITNEPGWSLNEISHLTYFMAFGHQVSCQPPGVPNVLYAAENMAKRGRNNFRTHMKLERIRTRQEPSTSTEISEEMIDELSSKLNTCTLKNRNFWA